MENLLGKISKWIRITLLQWYVWCLRTIHVIRVPFSFAGKTLMSCYFEFLISPSLNGKYRAALSSLSFPSYFGHKYYLKLLKNAFAYDHGYFGQLWNMFLMIVDMSDEVMLKQHFTMADYHLVSYIRGETLRIRDAFVSVDSKLKFEYVKPGDHSVALYTSDHSMSLLLSIIKHRDALHAKYVAHMSDWDQFKKSDLIALITAYEAYFSSITPVKLLNPKFTNDDGSSTVPTQTQVSNN